MANRKHRSHTESTRARDAEALIHSLDGGLDSGRGFGRIGEPASPQPPARPRPMESARPKPRRTR